MKCSSAPPHPSSRSLESVHGRCERIYGKDVWRCFARRLDVRIVAFKCSTLEGFGEGNSNLWRKHLFVVQLVLCPGHQIIHILWRRQLCRFLKRHPITPVVLVLWPRRHDGTISGRAELCDCSVEHVYLVEEVDGIYGKPFVDVFAFGKCDGETQVSAAQGGFCILFELVLLGALGNVLFGFECLVLVSCKG